MKAAAAAGLLLLVLAGCSAPAAHPSASATGTTTPAVPSCVHARGMNSALASAGPDYVAADGTWRESNNLTGLQEVRTCEGPPDTKVLPP